jgi:hypothetical protein
MTFRQRYFEALGLDPGAQVEEEHKKLAAALGRAAGSVILDRNTNGRTRWYVEGSKQTYHEWQESKAAALGGGA